MRRIALLEIDKFGTDIAYRTLFVRQITDRHITHHRKAALRILNDMVVTVKQS